MDKSQNSNNRFADYFVICGLDLNSGLEPDKLAGDNLHCSPLERAYKSKILGHYPENVPWNPFDPSAVCLLCLPNGLRFRTQKHSVTQSPNFHSFVVTREDGKRYYGFSLIFYEEVRNRDICSAMQILQSMYITELSSGQIVSRNKQLQQTQGQSRSLPRHFKIMANNPGAAPGYYDIIKDRLYVSKSIAIICQNAFVQASKLFLENLYKCYRSLPKKQGLSTGLSLESYVYNLLYEVQIPTSGKSLVIYLPSSEPNLPPISMVLQNPAPPLELPQFDFSLRLMFTWLGVENVVQLFTCLLLENQVLLRSNDCQRLMTVAECITTLLFPFSWPHVYVPILPASLHNFLDAPVPFVMGLYYCSENLRVASEASLCYLDIDKPRIQLPEEMVPFPHERAFIDELWSALDKNGVSVTNSDITRSNIFHHHDVMSNSCTLPGRPQSLNRRKPSLHDTLDCERPPSPPGSARTEALQRIADIVRRTGVALDKTENQQPADHYSDDLRFNNSIREIFLNRFVHIFQSYENFVIFPNQGREEWFNNRDSMINFDKASFLSDQPEQHRPFLSRFLETQMFATLVDNKIMASWNEPDINLLILDNRIKMLRHRYGGENLMRSLCYEPCTSAPESQRFLDRRLNNPEFEAPAPQEIMNKRPVFSRMFPLLDKDILNKMPIVNKGSIPRASALANRPVSIVGERSLQKSTNVEVSPALIAQANWTFVEKLLKDCKSKTKRMLLAKLGAEGVALGNGGPDTPGSVEETTLVASLCDFLERVWSHGVQCKRGKSALWSHLSLYQEQRQGFSGNKNDSKYLSPVDMAKLEFSRQETWKPSIGMDSKNTRQEQLQPLPDSLLFDLANIQAMSDVKTHIGMARAWVRLALERKHLSRHLRALLSDHALLKAQYKRSAFLRCEEEKDQFLYHLLSLNAVEYYCFTSTYQTTMMHYRIVIYPSRKGMMTSANAWVVLSGTLGETQHIPVPRGSLNFNFRHKNIGILTTMKIGHDNTGLSAKWMIEYVLVRNEITGHIYKFPCGRWLGRGVDDGSTERLLVATIVPKHVDGDELAQICRTPPRCRSPGIPKPELRPSDIQHMLGDCVNNIVKWHYKRTPEKNTSLTALLCGEGGLVQCLEQVFLFGFRSSRLFGRNLYLWDYFVRVKDQFEVQLVEETCLSENYTDSMSRSTMNDRSHAETQAVWRCYCHLVDEIHSSSNSLGKDGKFQLFICLSVREHLLHRMLVPMSLSRATVEMFEDNSFLRNRGLLTFLRQILLPLDDLEVVLENSVTHGISSPCV